MFIAKMGHYLDTQTLHYLTLILMILLTLKNPLLIITQKHVDTSTIENHHQVLILTNEKMSFGTFWQLDWLLL